jgi:hypothetical protein
MKSALMNRDVTRPAGPGCHWRLCGLLCILATVYGCDAAPDSPDQESPTVAVDASTDPTAIFAAAPFQPVADLLSHWRQSAGNSPGMVHWRTSSGGELFHLRSETGDEDLSQIADVKPLFDLDLAHTRVTDAGLASLPNLSTLRRADLSYSPVTDEGLRLFAGCTDMREFRVTGTQITDEGLAKIDEDWLQLEFLFVGETDITDAVLEQLSRVPSLRGLELRDCRHVTGSGLAALTGLPELRYLSLSGTSLRDEDLDVLKSLPQLTLVDLVPEISDAGLQHLADLSHLEALVISGDKVTDAGLGNLADLPRLQGLTLRNTAVTSDGIISLERCKSLRTLHIISDQYDDAAEVELRRRHPDLIIVH